MIIFPAIDIQNGKCVRLQQGKFDKKEVYGDDPAFMAVQWENKGAEYLHIVDLDGALHGKRVNEDAIKNIVRSIHIPIQLGGGIRTFEDIEQVLKMGISRVILGTSALQTEGFIEKAVELFGEKIAVSIDAMKGYVAVRGWTDISNVKAIDFAEKLEAIGLKTLVYTDIEKDGMLSGPNFLQLEELNNITNINIIASGGISSKDHVEKLKALKLYGAIIGKALYTGNIQLDEI